MFRVGVKDSVGVRVSEFYFLPHFQPASPQARILHITGTVYSPQHACHARFAFWSIRVNFPLIDRSTASRSC